MSKAKLFNQIQNTRVKKNKFDLSHDRKFSFNMGDLIPILVQEVVPGDNFKLNTELMLRLQPLLSPMMHHCKVMTTYFFVPNRLVYDGWQDFITGGEDGASTEIAPYFYADTAGIANFRSGTLSDYMGVPSVPPSIAAITQDLKISALPFRAYQLIYNEYFRDQNLQAKILMTKSSGLIAAGAERTALLGLRKKCWEKDYFTSALPFAQKGTAVDIPTDVNYRTVSRVFNSDGTTPVGGDHLQSDNVTPYELELATANKTARIDNILSIGAKINDLRRAVRVQEWLERQARAGSRYIETILSNFGILSSDARLQRPEFLGGGTNSMVISEVLTTVSDGTDPAATMKGHGVAVGNQNGFKRQFEEHGHIIGLMTLIPTTAYQQGLPRGFSRFDKYDYAWPLFANLGEQGILCKEIYWDYDNLIDDDSTFGYQSRYAEYKFKESTVHGDFRNTLAFWGMQRIFTATPPLNSAFVTADPTFRVFAVTDPTKHHVLGQVYHNISALRPLPYFGTPTV